MIFNTLDEYDDFLKASPNFTGVCVVFRPNGKKRFECNFANGNRHGKQFGWYSNGQKWYEENLINGKHHGKQYYWHENGRKWFERNFANGFLLGIQLDDGETCEIKPEKNPVWYILVKETI